MSLVDDQLDGLAAMLNHSFIAKDVEITFHYSSNDGVWKWTTTRPGELPTGSASGAPTGAHLPRTRKCSHPHCDLPSRPWPAIYCTKKHADADARARRKGSEAYEKWSKRR